jgi:hypothetical protein
MNTTYNTEEATETSLTNATVQEAAISASTGYKNVMPAVPEAAVRVLDWAGTETYLVAIKAAPPRNSTAFHLSF